MNPRTDNSTGYGLPPAGGQSNNVPAPTPTPYDDTQSAHSQQLVDSAPDDVLLKQAVVQAEAIVARNAQDPYRQVQELENLKAAYLNKRFGKDSKLSKK